MNQKSIIQKMMFVLLCFSVSAYAQTGKVGINTKNPQATLDVVAKTTNGSQAEGFLVPRLTGDQIKLADAKYGPTETGTIVYATAAATSPNTGKTAAITAPGFYYYYDDNVSPAWRPLNGSNIYNSNGTLTTDRTVTQDTKSLTFSTATKGSVVLNSTDGLLDVQSTNSAIIINSVANTAAAGTPKIGMLIYDISATCLKFYEEAGWTPCISNRVATVSIVPDCNVNGFMGSYNNGVAMAGSNKFSVTLTNRTLSDAIFSFQTSDLALTGVSGVSVLSVSPSSATIPSGQSVTVEYTLGGAPTANGTLTGTWTKLSLTCSKTVAVVDPIAALTLNCTTPNNSGNIINGNTYTNADGITTSISYTGGDGSAYTMQTINSTGVTGLVATLDAGTLTSTGTLVYKITGTASATGTASFSFSMGGKSCTFTRTVGGAAQISTLDCDGATHNGTLSQGIDSTGNGVTSVISYTLVNGGTHNGQTVLSTGVGGLTAKLLPGTLASGPGTLTYTISGTPDSAGTASFAINIGGKTCTLNRTVSLIPPGITLAQNQYFMIASVFDANYLPYTAPSGTAAVGISDPDANPEQGKIIDYQGSIAGLVNVIIPVTGTVTTSGTIPSFTKTITVPASMTSDSKDTPVTLQWDAQPYTPTTKYIKAKIYANNLNAIKLDINKGVGSDYLGMVMGTFTYPYDSAGNTTSYDLRVIAGIPDKMFGVADNTSSITSHLMLYTSKYAEDGNVWLNNNLGADFANYNKTAFSPNGAPSASSATDHLAYGSLFQWGRKADGHELINWTNATTGAAVNGPVAVGTLGEPLATASFITNSTAPNDWRNPQDGALWSGVAGVNNPCPSGYRLPTGTELSNLYTIIPISSTTTAYDSSLALRSAGYRRNTDGGFIDVSTAGRYWSSTPSTGTGTGKSDYLRFTTSATITVGNRADGYSVRCIKN